MRPRLFSFLYGNVALSSWMCVPSYIAIVRDVFYKQVFPIGVVHAAAVVVKAVANYEIVNVEQEVVGENLVEDLLR